MAVMEDITPGAPFTLSAIVFGTDSSGEGKLGVYHAPEIIGVYEEQLHEQVTHFTRVVEDSMKSYAKAMGLDAVHFRVHLETYPYISPTAYLGAPDDVEVRIARVPFLSKLKILLINFLVHRYSWRQSVRYAGFTARPK